jgi:3,4-dihydroxy 2-butanone 4-phosphate synthase/GTP cyclohydrolase II
MTKKKAVTRKAWKFNTIEEAIDDIREGRMVVLIDDEDRENEGDLTIAAEKVTPEAINFMAKYGRGLICLSLTPEKVQELNLPLMADLNTSRFSTAFTVSIEARKGVTTGISAHDRAKDLARLAGLNPSGVICEIMNDDGTMSRVPELAKFARKHKLKMITIKDLIQYRMNNECLVTRQATTKLPTQYGGDFMSIVYGNQVDDTVNVALVKGEISPDDDVLVRVHSECLTGDVFGSKRCDCGEQLHKAMAMIKKEGKGVVLYMRQEGRGIGLANKLKAYALQDEGMDTVEANVKLGFKPDLRDYGIGAQMLVDLGVRKMRLMTNNPKKLIGLEGYGLRVVERVPIEVHPHDKNIKYLAAKKKKMGHMLKKV